MGKLVEPLANFDQNTGILRLCRQVSQPLMLARERLQRVHRVESQAPPAFLAATFRPPLARAFE